MPLPVFKTGVARYPGQAGSIPVRLRYHRTRIFDPQQGGAGAVCCRCFRAIAPDLVTTNSDNKTNVDGLRPIIPFGMR